MRSLEVRFAQVSWRAFLVLGMLAASRGTAQSPLNDLFQDGKAQFRKGAYAASLETFGRLEELSRGPGYETARLRLQPAIAFYRGANLAALGRKDEALLEFEKYLSVASAARLDPSVYPKHVIDVFTQAQQRAAPKDVPADADSGMATEYARFVPEDRAAVATPDERWAEGPVRYFMTKKEKADWKALSSPADRTEFVYRFWQARDLSMKPEYERRLQFADVRLKRDEVRGSETDRGLVFVLLGPPSYVGQTPLQSDDDSLQAMRNAPTTEKVQNADGTTSTRLVPRLPLSAQKIQGTRETWHYRRDRLPPSVRFTEVNFMFLTKEGTGVGVLQRDREVLQTLETVAKTYLPKE